MKSVQEVTFFNRQEGLEIEVHLNPFGTNNMTYERMNDWFEDVFQTNVTIDIQGIPVRTMSATDHMLFLIFHAFKHFMQQGFGIRLMLDALLYMEKYQEKIDWEYVRKGMEAVGADRFFSDLIVVGNQYLGFALPESEKKICPDELLEHMLHMGTFGMTQKAAVGAGEFVAVAILKKKHTESGRGKISAYAHVLFPLWKTWTSWRPYLEDRPWCLPVEWIKRVVRFLRGESVMSSLSDINAGYALANQRLELMKKYQIFRDE